MDQAATEKIARFGRASAAEIEARCVFPPGSPERAAALRSVARELDARASKNEQRPGATSTGSTSPPVEIEPEADARVDQPEIDPPAPEDAPPAER